MKEFLKTNTITYNLISFTGFKALIIFSLLLESPKSYDEIIDYFANHDYIKETISIDTIRVYLNSLKRIGCVITKTKRCEGSKYVLVSHPFELTIAPEQIKSISKIYKTISRTIDIDEFESGEELLNSEKNYDIIVLDYLLGSTNGLTVAKELRKRNVLSSIIFLTSYPNFMIDAFEVNTFRFLLKPIDKSKFFKAIDDYIKIVDANYPITIIQNKELKKINSNEICYIEADGKYSNIHLSDKIMHCSKTLAGVTKLLPAYCFVKTHRAFVVNLHYIKSYSSDTVYLSNGESAFLSKNYQKSFQTSYMNFLKKNYVRL